MQDLKDFLTGVAHSSQYIRQPEINLSGLPLQQEVGISDHKPATRHHACVVFSKAAVGGCNGCCTDCRQTMLCKSPQQNGKELMTDLQVDILGKPVEVTLPLALGTESSIAGSSISGTALQVTHLH